MQFPKELLEPANAAEADRALAACQQIDPSLSSIEAIVEAVRTNPQIATVLRGILTPRHPSQLYEALLEGAVLFATLWFVRTRARTPNGFLTGLFMICYAIFRIVVEYFREPDAALIGMFTRGQFFSLFVVALGVGFMVTARRRPTYPRKLPA
jgi:phosphatidylglycerol:prolipoprotein diacylglycerol transferase